MVLIQDISQARISIITQDAVQEPIEQKVQTEYKVGRLL